MHAQARAAAGDDDGIRSSRLQRRAQAVAVQSFAEQQALGAPATRRIDHVIVHRQRARVVGRDRRTGAYAHGTRTAFDEFGDAFQQVDEALRTGIHHAGLLQQRHLPRRVRQRAPGADQRPGEPAARVGLRTVRRGVQLIGEGGDDA